MAMNLVQFQRGLSLPEFQRRYGTEQQCCDVLEKARWPKGFCCPHCAHTTCYRIKRSRHPLFQCAQCQKQTSLTSGTLMHHTNLPLTIWFLAIYLVSEAKTGLSA